MTALTDDQLRQVAAHIAIDDARMSTSDIMGIGEQLPDVLRALGIDAPDDVDDDTLSDIADHVASAIITVEWPDSGVRLAGVPALLEPGEAL